MACLLCVTTTRTTECRSIIHLTQVCLCEMIAWSHLGLSVSEAARLMGIRRKKLSDIVNCRAGISPELAIRLHNAFGGGAETWYRLQASYEMAQAMKNEGRN